MFLNEISWNRFLVCNWYHVLIGSGNVLTSVRHQTVIWINVDEVLWRHMASLGHNELIALVIYSCKGLIESWGKNGFQFLARNLLMELLVSRDFPCKTIPKVINLRRKDRILHVTSTVHNIVVWLTFDMLISPIWWWQNQVKILFLSSDEKWIS